MNANTITLQYEETKEVHLNRCRAAPCSLKTVKRNHAVSRVTWLQTANKI